MYSQTEPVVESSTNIKFLPMTYGYDKLFSHMCLSKISPWTNNWTDVFDFTPGKKSATGEPNFYIAGDPLVYDFVRPLEHAKEIIEKASSDELVVKSLAEVDDEVADQIVEEYKAN